MSILKWRRDSCQHMVYRNLLCTLCPRSCPHYLHLLLRTATAMIRMNVVTARAADSRISFLSRGVLRRQNLGMALKPNAQLASSSGVQNNGLQSSVPVGPLRHVGRGISFLFIVRVPKRCVYTQIYTYIQI
jgi:hypothetical protein